MSPEEYFKEKDKFKKRKSIDEMMKEYEEYLYKQKYGPRDKRLGEKSSSLLTR